MFNTSRQLVTRLLKAQFLRNLFMLSVGAVIGQIASVLAMPIIARLYTPADFGILGTYTSILAILSIVGMLRYESSIPIARNNDELVNILVLCTGIASFAGFLCLGICLVIVKSLGVQTSAGRLTILIWFLPVGMVAMSMYRALSMWAIRVQDFRLLSRTKITQAIGLVVTQLLLGIAHVGPAGLVTGNVVGQSGGVTTIARSLLKKERENLASISWNKIKKVADAYRRFPIFSMWAALLDAGGGGLPLFFIISVFGATVAGWYTFTLQYLLYPMSLLGANLFQVLYGEITALKHSNPQQMVVAFKRRFSQIALIGTAIIVGLNILAPWLVPWLFGAKWTNGVTVLQLLAPMQLAGFIAAPFGSVPEVLGRQDLHLIREVFRVVVMCISLLLAYLLRADWRITLALISIASVINSSFYLWISWHILQRYVQNTTVSSISIGG